MSNPNAQTFRTLASLREALSGCALRDSHRLTRKLSELERLAHRGPINDADLTALSLAIADSVQLCERRQAAIPAQIHYPPSLPVSQRADEIGKLLAAHQVLIVAGDTGSGKTTQLPKICLGAGFGRRGLIGHTQPRRLAAISVANRIAEELGSPPGAGVGFQVRFNEQVSDSTYLKLMTDGILLAEIQTDRFLNQYEVLIIDEAHERSLNIDFLLGFLYQLLPKRPDLKLVITSATIDVEKFSRHFHDAPIVSVSGRSYPVETRYAPLHGETTEAGDEAEQQDGILRALREIEELDRQQQQSSGDVLVFLSGERDIRDAANFLRKQKLKNTEILPLYARLRQSEQIRIFQGHTGRRIVLATNVAETSLTVPGINYVIDTGLARISRYSLQSKVQRLPIEPISQASANQRKGRCGRLANGVCIRLYSEADFASRPAFTDPEIRRTNLASVILRMKHLRLGEPESFPFLEPPEQKAVNEGTRLLIELNALTPGQALTDIGRHMAILPVDPRHARMLIAANKQRCLREILIIVSALSSQDPREISQENRALALQRLAVFNHPDSDFLSLVNLWEAYEQERQNLTQSQLRKYCKNHFLNFMRMREWRELHRQLLLSCQKLGMRLNREPATYAAIHQSIITGSLNQIACLDERKTFLGSRNRKFTLFASSVLAAKPPKWIVTGEQIETSDTFATMAARIEPEWVEQAALHLVKREHFEPHWSKRRQEVMAYEKVKLYGLVIIEKSLIRFAPIDPAGARDIFIREGLAAEQIESRLPFLRRNREFLQSLAKQEEKLRRPDLLVSERDIVNFYAARIPDHVASTRQLDLWWREQAKTEPDTLLMTQAALLDADSALSQLDAYPDSAPLQHNRIAISYRFAPGETADGATLDVPLAILNQLSKTDVDWAVPGILREKCISLVKGLPKSMRTNFIPVSGFVDSILPQLRREDGDVIAALLVQLRRFARVDIERSLLEQVELPAHLQIKIRVLDEQQKQIAFDADLDRIRQTLARVLPTKEVENSSGETRHALEVTGVTEWNFGVLPKQVEIGEDLVIIRYPALVDRGAAVDVRLFEDETAADYAHRQGLMRLFMLRSVQQRNMLNKQFTRFANKHALLLPANQGNLVEQAIGASYVAAFQLEDLTVRSAPEFDQALNNSKPSIITCGDKLERLLAQILQTRSAICRSLDAIDDNRLGYLRKDIDNQLNALISDNFLLETGLIRLQEFPRYLAAIELRLSKVPHFGEKDENHTRLIDSFWQKYRREQDRASTKDRAAVLTLRWMIEEFRVSLFAQQLGTRMAVSEKRLDKQLETIARQRTGAAGTGS